MYKQSLGSHQCFCNSCGDDLSAMADKTAEAKFAEFKQEFENKQIVTVGAPNSVSDTFLKDLQVKHS